MPQIPTITAPSGPALGGNMPSPMGALESFKESQADTRAAWKEAGAGFEAATTGINKMLDERDRMEAMDALQKITDETRAWQGSAREQIGQGNPAGFTSNFMGEYARVADRYSDKLSDRARKYLNESLFRQRDFDLDRSMSWESAGVERYKIKQVGQIVGAGSEELHNTAFAPEDAEPIITNIKEKLRTLYPNATEEELTAYITPATKIDLEARRSNPALAPGLPEWVKFYHDNGYIKPSEYPRLQKWAEEEASKGRVSQAMTSLSSTINEFGEWDAVKAGEMFRSEEWRTAHNLTDAEKTKVLRGYRQMLQMKRVEQKEKEAEAEDGFWKEHGIAWLSGKMSEQQIYQIIDPKNGKYKVSDNYGKMLIHENQRRDDRNRRLGEGQSAAYVAGYGMAQRGEFTRYLGQEMGLRVLQIEKLMDIQGKINNNPAIYGAIKDVQKLSAPYTQGQQLIDANMIIGDRLQKNWEKMKASNPSATFAGKKAELVTQTAEEMKAVLPNPTSVQEWKKNLGIKAPAAKGKTGKLTINGVKYSATYDAATGIYTTTDGKKYQLLNGKAVEIP